MEDILTTDYLSETILNNYNESDVIDFLKTIKLISLNDSEFENFIKMLKVLNKNIIDRDGLYEVIHNNVICTFDSEERCYRIKKELFTDSIIKDVKDNNDMLNITSFYNLNKDDENFKKELFLNSIIKDRKDNADIIFITTFLKSENLISEINNFDNLVVNSIELFFHEIAMSKVEELIKCLKLNNKDKNNERINYIIRKFDYSKHALTFLDNINGELTMNIDLFTKIIKEPSIFRFEDLTNEQVDNLIFCLDEYINDEKVLRKIIINRIDKDDISIPQLKKVLTNYKYVLIKN